MATQTVLDLRPTSRPPEVACRPAGPPTCRGNGRPYAKAVLKRKHKFRHDCKGGTNCFVETRFPMEIFSAALPENIGFTDVDRECEINRRYLRIEDKPSKEWGGGR